MFELDLTTQLSDDELMHIGMPRRSGRYPWGSGKENYQRSGDFLSRIESLKKEGLSETKIAETIGLTTTQLRTQKSLALDERKIILQTTAKGLRDKGYSLNEIAAEMGYKNDSSVRALLNPNTNERRLAAKKTADFLKEQVDKKEMVEVGKSVELELGVSREKMKEAFHILEMEGYNIYKGRVPQVSDPRRGTTITVLTKPDIQHKEIFEFDRVKSLKEYVSHDQGDSFDKYQYPKSLSSKRLKVRFAEEGGEEKDGLIELRRGVNDISLGNSNYAQVRILVDGKKYLKGMAVYSDDMPDGVDMIFNTNKTKAKAPGLESLKDIKEGDNPFGATIKAGGQSYYTDASGKKQMSVINKTRDEGDWDKWANNLPSQFLGKQSLDLITKQLNITKADRQLELEEISNLTNPTVKRKLLDSFASDADAAAVHLKSAALPRQRYQVIIPIPEMKDNEIYAPNFKNGEKVSLIRFPHGGTFEIPTLTVNNKIGAAKKVIGSAPLDAVGINKKVADLLSGADFDGDFVQVIPNSGKIKISTRDPLKGLEGFDPKVSYPYREGMKTMKNTNTQMGIISNLITDMTLKGADENELARAVRHSMTVIDAEKHKLDYKRSYTENGIASLKKTYQGETDSTGRYHEGAGTLLSRAKGEVDVSKRVGQPKIDSKTGKLIYNEKPEYYEVTKKDPVTGKRVGTREIKERTIKVSRMSATDDARTLVSRANTPQELLYAEYANSMKSLANQARKELINTPRLEYKPEANKQYKDTVTSLNDRLLIAEKNAPKERQAQLIANSRIKYQQEANPDMSKDETKKLRTNELSKARIQVGAQRESIKITDKDWEAIQAGAITDNTLTRILNHSDIDSLRSKATPRATTSMSSVKINKMNAMLDGGRNISDIADALGVSRSTVSRQIKEQREGGAA